MIITKLHNTTSSDAAVVAVEDPTLSRTFRERRSRCHRYRPEYNVI